MAPAAPCEDRPCVDGEGSFPADFVWGASTGAYQIEGALTAGGRGVGIWEPFAAGQGGAGALGDVACDHYHLFERDVALMRQLGLRHYNFSVAWPRVQPAGRGPASPEGLEFYGRLVDCLVRQGIEPVVTLYHWDLPQALEEELGGWASREVVPLFAAYAAEVFRALSRRGVRRWLTLQEPWCVAVLGYGRGLHAPGRAADAAAVYRVGHHLLLAHAEAARVFRDELHLDAAGGRLGIALSADWAEPAPAPGAPEGAALNAEAAERVLDCSIGWFAGPLCDGDYPAAMRARCGALPCFAPAEAALLRRSADFLCLRHRNVELVEAVPGAPGAPGAAAWEVRILQEPAWPLTDAGDAVAPWALRSMLLWVQRRYQPRGGVIVMGPSFGSPDCCRQRAVDDTERVQHLHDYVWAMRAAMADGADVRGYFAWALLDGFEWHLGYSVRCGLIHVDFTTQQRTPKASARWFSHLVGQRAQAAHRRDPGPCRPCWPPSKGERGGPLWWAVDAGPSESSQPCPPAPADPVTAALLALFQSTSLEDEAHEAALASLDPASTFRTLEAVEMHLAWSVEQRVRPGALRPPSNGHLRQTVSRAAAEVRDALALHALATGGGAARRGPGGEPPVSEREQAPQGRGEGPEREGQPRGDAVRAHWDRALERAARWKDRQLGLLWGVGPAAAAQYGQLAVVDPAALAAALSFLRHGQAEAGAGGTTPPPAPGGGARVGGAAGGAPGSTAPADLVREALLHIFRCGLPARRAERRGYNQGDPLDASWSSRDADGRPSSSGPSGIARGPPANASEGKG